MKNQLRFLLLGRLFLGLFGLIWMLAGAANTAMFAQNSQWRELTDGLHLAEFQSPEPTDVGDSRITVLKIDPKFFEFKLLNATRHNRRPRTLSNWAKEFGMIATINAGMYQKDLLTSVGYMKNFDHVNNGHVNPNNTIFAFAPNDSTLPDAQIIDRTCENFDSLRNSYQCMLQSIRMISCTRENVWSRQPNRWSISVLGMDTAGNILFIFSQSPFTVHDFNNHLLKLPIDISKAMYLDGGSKAGFYLSFNGVTIEKYGIYENALLGAENMNTTWPIPNALGIVPKNR